LLGAAFSNIEIISESMFLQNTTTLSRRVLNNRVCSDIRSVSLILKMKKTPAIKRNERRNTLDDRNADDEMLCFAGSLLFKSFDVSRFHTTSIFPSAVVKADSHVFLRC
jgi:hypothetical protein